MVAESSKKQRGGKRRGRPWPKGVSGNPGGRAKEVGHVRELAKKHTEEAIVTLVEVMQNGAPDRARAQAAEALLDRAWGRPPQELQHSVPPDGISLGGLLIEVVKQHANGNGNGKAH
jgi:hypothetical protein